MANDNGHTLVVVYLRGGADGLSMVVPFEDDRYYAVRPTLAVSKGDTLALDSMFGLHQHLAPLEASYKDGALAIIHGVGSEDDTRSHFEAQDLMEHAGFGGGGWLGRYLRYRPSPAVGPLATVAIGKATPESLRGAPSTVTLENFDTFDFGEDSRRYLEDMGALYGDVDGYLGNAAQDTLSAMDTIMTLKDQDYSATHGALYGGDAFSRKLRQVAQLVKANVGMEAVTVDLDGWDSHFTQAVLMGSLMRQLSQGLAAFYQDLGDKMEKVTVVVMTEFGRRVYENASLGTDHGRGGVMFVLGGGVQGGRVVTEWPGLDDAVLEGPGDLPVTLNYRDVLAAVMKRHGSMEDTRRVFPDYTAEAVKLYG